MKPSNLSKLVKKSVNAPKDILRVGEIHTFRIHVVDDDLVGTLKGQIVDAQEDHGFVHYVLKPLKISASLLNWSHPPLFTHHPGNKVNPFHIGDEADVEKL